MGMSTHVVGFRPPDEEWKRMKELWDLSEKYEVSLPIEVEEFFNGECPEDAGIEVDLKDVQEMFQDDGRSGFDIVLSKLPKSIDRIRFYNSW